MKGNNGVTLHSAYCRIDRTGIDLVCKDFLNIEYSRGDAWVIGNVCDVV